MYLGRPWHTYLASSNMFVRGRPFTHVYISIYYTYLCVCLCAVTWTCRFCMHSWMIIDALSLFPMSIAWRTFNIIGWSSNCTRSRKLQIEAQVHGKLWIVVQKTGIGCGQCALSLAISSPRSPFCLCWVVRAQALDGFSLRTFVTGSATSDQG